MDNGRLLQRDAYEMEEIPDTSDKVHVFSALSHSPERVVGASYAPMATNQCIINEGTDDELVCRAYRETIARKCIFFLFVICTAGLALIVFYWKPEWKAWMRSTLSDNESATHLVLRDRYKRHHVKAIKLLEFISSKRPTFQRAGQRYDGMNGDVTTSQLSSPKLYFSLADVNKQGFKSARYFEHKFQKFFWNGETYVPLRGLHDDTTVYQLRGMGGGLREQDKPDRQILFGKNSITVEITPLIVLLFREILNPYYAFQLFAIIIWCADAYFSLPAVIVLLSSVSISISLYLTRKQDQMIHKMSSGTGTVQVLVNGNFESRESTELLPGDVIEVQANKHETLWCDCVLLSGNCVVSESMLTGESAPILKTPLVSSGGDNEKEYYDLSRHKQHTLYGGTKVVDVQYRDKDDPPKALVIRTGFYTEKGRMIESMLSSSPTDYKLYNDSLKFILVMAIIGFFGSILAIAFLAQLKADAGHIVKRVLDLITTVVPPGLPAALTVATIYAQRRLRKAKIFCISPPRITVSGKINCMCFDKTGTLTESNLKLWGVVPCKDNTDSERDNIEGAIKPLFSDVVHDCQQLPRYGEAGIGCLNALGYCHSLVNVDGEVSGDPVDLELFKATNWKMSKSQDERNLESSYLATADDSTSPKLSLARIFQFNSTIKRMSVVTSNGKMDCMRVYVKGAPESTVSQCNEETVPSNFDEKLRFFTRQGYRVLALASRDLECTEDVSALDRKHVESNLRFLGLVILTNPLKPGTEQTISELKTSNIRTVMATGDNLETAMYVARKCNMVNKSDRIVVVDAKLKSATDEIKITWTDDDTENSVSTTVNAGVRKKDRGSIENQLRPTYHLALSGNTLELIRQHSISLFHRLLMSATVLARMKPDHKRDLIQGLQEIKYIVGMCGDGANDCGALKVAHAGIAIADVEASIVAPFTSMTAGISCCVKLIREGRAALVTSFGMIKYLCVYCFVQYLSLIFLFRFNSYFSDFQFLFADIGVTGVVTLFFAVGDAAKTLAKKQPHASLVSPVMMTCLLLQIALLVLFQTLSFVTLQSQTAWYTPLVNPNMTHPKENILCDENTVMFYTSCFQNMVLAFVFYKGLPYRQPLYQNVPYFVAFLLVTIWVFIMMFAPVAPIAEFFSLTQLNYDVRFKVVLVTIYACNLLFAVLVEKVFLDSDTFRRALQKVSNVFCRFLNRKDDGDQDEDVSHVKLQRELALDCKWPPVGQQTVIKT